MGSPARRLLWEFCHEVLESQQPFDAHNPAWFIVNLDERFLFHVCHFLLPLEYRCTSTTHHGSSGVIARFEHNLVLS